MAITTQLVSVGTAGATLCSPTIDAQDVWVENLEPSNDISDYSRHGYTYSVSRYQTIANGGNGTPIHFQIGWVEKYNGWNEVWLNGTSGQTVRLCGGERIQLELEQGEGLVGEAIREGVQIAVMRRD